MTGVRDVRKESAVITERLKIVMGRDPWTSLSEPQRVDHLPELLGALLRMAFDPGRDPILREEVLEVARRHGVDRRYQGFEEEVIFEEYYLLRSEACTGLRMFHQERDLEAVISRLDAAISLATLGSLRGLHGRGVEGL